MIVVAATILWTVGIAAFAVPQTASAAAPGSLVKGSLSTVYYYAADGQRYTFPNVKTFNSWYTSFAGVVMLSDSELAAIPLAGNVVYRPGSRWVKIQSDPKTYAVTPNGAIRWIETEAVAMGLAGAAWNTFIDDVPEVFFVDYSVGSSLMSAAAYDGMYVSSGASKYVVWGGQKRLVSAAGQSANGIQDRFFLTPSSDVLASVPAGAEVTGAENALSNPAQIASSSTPAAGGLSVSLSSDTPAAATIADGASQVRFMSFNLSAASGDATVTSLTVTMAGLGVTSDLSSLYLFEGNNRLTNARSINSTTRTAIFGGMSLKVSAGQTRTITVVGDMTNGINGGNTIQFQIASAAAVASNATVSGSFPVASNVMTTSATDVGLVTVDDTGTISNPKVGEIAKIANFRLTANSTEGFKLYRLRLEVDEAKDHSQYELRQNNSVLATGAQSGNYVLFELTTPYEVAQGNNREFEVYAKVGGENSDGLRVRVEETTDVYAIGLKYGFGVRVTNNFGTAFTTCTTDAAGYDCSQIQAGQLTFAFNGPSTGDIGENQNGVVIWEGTFTAQNLVEIRNLQFDLDGGSGTADFCTGACGTASTTHNYQNARLVSKTTGATISGPYDMTVTSDTVAAVNLTDDFTMNAGESLVVQLKVDVQDNATFTDISANDAIRATLDVSETTARDTNNDSLTVGTDIIPGSDLTGNMLTVRLASLTVTVASTPASSTYVKGTSNVDVVGFSFSAGTASSITVSSTTFKMYGDDDAEHTTNDNKDVNVRNTVNSCSVYDAATGALIDGPESPAAFTSGTGSDITFSGFSWTVPASQSLKMVLRCNLANVTPTSSTNDSLTAEVDAAGDITAVDKDGNAVNGSTANTTQTIFQTVANAGSLTIARDGGSPNSTILLSNSTGLSASKFRFTSSNEAFVVDRLTIDNTSGSDTAVASVELHYANQAGEAKVASGFLTSSTYTFNGLDFYVPKDDNAVLTVKINTGEVSSSNSASGDLVNLDMSNQDTTEGEFRAVGSGSGTTIDDSDVDASFTGSGAGIIAAYDHEIRKTKPTISLASGSPSGAAIAGIIEVLRFNIAADSRGDVNVEELTFKMSSTAASSGVWNECTSGGASMEAGDVYLYDSEDLATDLAEDSDVSLLDSAGASCGNGEDLTYININFDGSTTVGEENIAAGTTATYILKLDVQDTNSPSAVNDDSLRIDIPDEVALDAALTTDFDAIVWNDSNATSGDMDAGSIGAGANDQGGTNGIDGDMVKNLPITGGSLIF